MTRPTIRSIPDAAEAIGRMWATLYEGDTIARFRTIVPTLVQFVRNGETFVRSGSTVVGRQAGWSNRTAEQDTRISEGGSLVVVGPYAIPAGYFVTIEADAVLRIA